MQSFLTVLVILVAAILLGVYLKFRRRVTDWMLGRKSKSSSDTPEFTDMASQYRRRATAATRATDKNNLLGIAALWEHDPEAAIPYLELAVDGAIGEKSGWNIANNLVIAYLQAGRYESAFSVLEQQRREGHLRLKAYTVCLIALGQWEKARRFHEQYALELYEEEKLFVDTIMAYTPSKPETLENIRSLITNSNDWWLYVPVLRELISLWELEVFFSQDNRYKVLAEQGQSVLDAMQGDVTIFTDPRLRWLRSVVSLVLPRCKTFQGCANLFGIVFNLEKWMDSLEPTPEWLQECQVFWKRVTYIFPRTADFLRQNDLTAEREFIINLLPSDAESMLKGITPRCEVYYSPTVGATFRVERVRNQYSEYHYVDWISQDYAALLQSALNPFVFMAKENPTALQSVESLIFGLVCYPEQLTSIQVQNALWQLDEPYRDQLVTLGFSMDAVNELQSMKPH